MLPKKVVPGRVLPIAGVKKGADPVSSQEGVTFYEYDILDFLSIVF